MVLSSFTLLGSGVGFMVTGFLGVSGLQALGLDGSGFRLSSALLL